jgi:hypothetical protein
MQHCARKSSRQQRDNDKDEAESHVADAIPNLAELTGPLSQLTSAEANCGKKRQKIVGWKSTHDQGFVQIKEVIVWGNFQLLSYASLIHHGQLKLRVMPLKLDFVHGLPKMMVKVGILLHFCLVSSLLLR